VFAVLFVVAEFSGGSLGQALEIGSGLSIGITLVLVEGINKAAREIYGALDFAYQA
jgi:transketolase N-terminal domain/subunit